MRKPVILITGAGGEIGHGLVTRLAPAGAPIITLDVNPLEPSLVKLVTREFTGSITDASLLDRVLAEFEVDRVFHLAALLSARSEFTPTTAHHVNVEGTLNLLEFAQRQGESHGRPVTFIYPSSIAAYGLPSLAAKGKAGRVREDQYAAPTTMYGCNKLYCEQLGHYYAKHYKQLSADAIARVDFRCVRFPGLISAMTIPSGGTSDYAPEMIHFAARDERYNCFVRPDTTIPFMAMPDGVDALLTLAAAPRDRLTRTAYNLTAFSASASEIREEVVAAFPSAVIDYAVDVKRQGIIDSWPADVDDSAARHDSRPRWSAGNRHATDETRESVVARAPASGRRTPLRGAASNTISGVSYLRASVSLWLIHLCLLRALCGLRGFVIRQPHK
ncbi:MAG: NAD-dependent epimerase/dehydratase family protein [Acidobacteria bacterium]|nr:NAD-dependent epimerase/dehydratase family protein [Acidobacteriota bacterium]